MNADGQAEMADDWPFVSIIVPVYNGGRTIDALLTSLLALDYLPDQREILIVDNNSTDDTTDYLIEQFKQHDQLSAAVLIQNDRNLGFGGAANKGASIATGEWLLFVNPDLELDRAALTNLLESVRAESSVGLASGRATSRPSAVQGAGSSREATAPHAATSAHNGVGVGSQPGQESLESSHLEAGNKRPDEIALRRRSGASGPRRPAPQRTSS